MSALAKNIIEEKFHLNMAREVFYILLMEKNI